MPTALMMTVHPVSAGAVAANLSRATHAAILRLIASANPELAARLHNQDGPKPLTISNVLGMGARTQTATVTPEYSYGLRVTLLSPELEAVAQTWTPDTVGVLELDGSDWRVAQIARASAEHPWAGSVSYEELAAPALLRETGGAYRWIFEFASPVTFRQRGMNQPLPTADLVFGSLLDKWNAFAPLAFPEEVRRFAAECLAVSRFDIRSAVEPTKGGALQIGAVGFCSYTATHRDRYWLACLEPLARFSFYSGVGAGTARGFGRTRLVEE